MWYEKHITPAGTYPERVFEGLSREAVAWDEIDRKTGRKTVRLGAWSALSNLTAKQLET